MGLHTARLIFTVLLLILTLSNLAAGFWASAVAWALITMCVAYPFIRNGRIDLYYDDEPTRVVIVGSTPTGAAPITVVGGEEAPAAYQKLFDGDL
jgi:hypothetical protein